uniref:Secreted protein n=1 Tax=Zea mays TaxID=4577 RepID=C0PAX1_MAIZE|nr:unknown [Zea mays]|eukprot:NP_001168984.1 uncharacterized protein LOC100382813 precursor [Zea mays]
MAELDASVLLSCVLQILVQCSLPLPSSSSQCSSRDRGSSCVQTSVRSSSQLPGCSAFVLRTPAPALFLMSLCSPSSQASRAPLLSPPLFLVPDALFHGVLDASPPFYFWWPNSSPQQQRLHPWCPAAPWSLRWRRRLSSTLLRCSMEWS